MSIERRFGAIAAGLRTRGPVLRVFQLGTRIIVCWRAQTEMWTECERWAGW